MNCPHCKSEWKSTIEKEIQNCPFCQKKIFNQDVEKINTKVTKEDGEWIDEYGIKFSFDKEKLIKMPDNIKKYIIPQGVKTIGNSAFRRCSNLTDVTIPNSVTNIGNSAFSGCESLIQVTIPNSVTSIEDYTFGYCENLTQITIPSSVTSIGDFAFWGCESLTQINIPKGSYDYFEKFEGIRYYLSILSIFKDVSTDENNAKEKHICINYDTPLEYQYSDDWQYPVAKFPQKGCIVWPYRKGHVARRGYTELDFEIDLKNTLPDSVMVLGDINLLTVDNARPYEPDIAIVYSSGDIEIRVDIEIDEPYTGGKERKPIHYVGCGDDFRDINLNNLGWIVVRFTERQIHCETMSCIAYIARLIHSIDSSFQIPAILRIDSSPTITKRWTEIEALLKGVSREREAYLNHAFNLNDNPEPVADGGSLTDLERELKSELRKLIIEPSSNTSSHNINIDNSKSVFKLDSDIQFYAKEHIYIYKGGERLTPVSSVIANLFSSFDSLYWSARKANERGITQSQILEEWDCKGAQAKEVGTYMHEQIESYLNHREYSDHYNFNYNGQYCTIRENVSIKKEMGYFTDFLDKTNISPFRTEWRIFDKEHMIAGTIDLICRNGNKYDIYDWKRSGKVFDRNPYQKGGGELSHLEATLHNKYYLQQNLYRYILERNYGIVIGKMYLVVLHTNYDQYRIVEVPRMDTEIKYILGAML